MNALTICELRLKLATLRGEAERLRQVWRTLSAGKLSTQMGKRVKQLDERASDYAVLVTWAEDVK